MPKPQHLPAGPLVNLQHALHDWFDFVAEEYVADFADIAKAAIILRDDADLLWRNSVRS